MIFPELVKYHCAGNWLKQICHFSIQHSWTLCLFQGIHNGEWPQNSKEGQIYIWMWSVQEIWADAVIDKITFICKLIDSL